MARGFLALGTVARAEWRGSMLQQSFTGIVRDQPAAADNGRRQFAAAKQFVNGGSGEPKSLAKLVNSIEPSRGDEFRRIIMPDTDFLAGPVGCDSRQRKTLHHRAGAEFERREAVQRKEEERKGVGLVRTRRPLKGRSLSGATGPQRPRVDSRWGPR